MEECFFEILEGGVDTFYRPSILCCLIEKVTPVVYPKYEKRAVIVNDSTLQDEILVAARVSSYFEALSLCSDFDQSSSFIDAVGGSCDLYVRQLILLSWSILNVMMTGDGPNAMLPWTSKLAAMATGPAAHAWGSFQRART